MKVLRLLPRFRSAYDRLEMLAAREDWERERIDAFQLERINALWRHAIAHVPYYRRLATERRLPEAFSGLNEFRDRVPILLKALIKQEPLAFLSERRRRGRWRRTGGSTGTPMSVYWEQAAHHEALRARYRFQAMWGVDIFDPAAFLWGHSASFAAGMSGWIARLRQPLEDWLRNRIRLSAYRLGRDDLRDYLRRIAAARVASIYGYSGALKLLADEAKAIGFSSQWLKVVFLTGEPATPDIVQTVEQVFGVPAVIEYGAVECAILAVEFRSRTLRVREDLAYLETLPRTDGRFDIVVTVLSNPSFPLVRYAIGDVTDAPLEVRNRGFAILANVAGRNNDLVLTRSGGYLHSSRFDALFKHARIPIRAFQVRQRADGSIAVSVEVTEDHRSGDIADLECAIRDLVEGYRVAIDVVRHLPPNPAGKRRPVTSELVPGGVPTRGASGVRACEVGRSLSAHQTLLSMPAPRAAESGPLPDTRELNVVRRHGSR